MPPHSFRLEKSSGFCHPASIPTRPSFLGCHNWRQISGVLEGRWRFTESLHRGAGNRTDLPPGWYISEPVGSLVWEHANKRKQLEQTQPKLALRTSSSWLAH